MKRSNINLLICLDMLLTEKSVTRAAERLEMSQPGMSNALARLRELTGDPLLIRSGNGFILTERALSLAQKVRSGIQLMEDIFSNEGPVNLANAKGTITLAAAESTSMAFVPALAEILGKTAPGMSLNVRAPDPEHIREWLSEGECDIALGYFPDLHPDLRRAPLFQQPLSCISARERTPNGTISRSEYLERQHVVFGSPFSPRSSFEQMLTTELAAAGFERLRTVHVSSALLAPYIVSGSSLIATMPTWFCRHYASFLPLTVSPLPFQVSPLETDMIWHERTHRQAVHVWLRDTLRSIIPGAAATGMDIRMET
ncbi:LysR family transcriptional regulator [Pseudomonas sp. N040]|uniref:LysR family transcriptional regulator n=1 Tax=Pseudomonas sp. N040 TaxID=2785325 RepID=UPI0018A325FC|nr:LysR family transcriptional regulator [Pseudomonas sp. N040]MBF7730094.1 LysR family transcriptional regulator [Pseudomonas sp. N040]MBW7013736.1 LysR family transcriptional regulator [Pseudomonas sp. N040]